MRKVLIFGNSGSGKSTLAGNLCARENLAHLDLDILAWEPTIPPTRKPLPVSAAAIRKFIQANEGWVIEGCYTDLLQQALPDANEIVFLNLAVADCMENARSRPWEPHKYESKAAQDANLEMLIDWIAQYHERVDTFSYRAHRALFDGYQGKKTMYVGNNETA